MHDIGNMITSFDELEKQAVLRFSEGAAAIYVDRDVAELGRLRAYTRSECASVLSQYMVTVDSRVGAMRIAFTRNETLSWIVLVFATGASILLALRVTSGISRPIHALVLSLRDFAEGRLDTPPLERGRNDEVALLVDSYNDMTSRIRGYVEEIRVASRLEAELKRQEIRSLRMENALKQSELETLQSRINPHFLFNTLNTISSLAEIEEAARTKSAVNSLAILLRAQLDSARSVLRLDRELESVEHYLRIQEIRFGARLRHEFRLSEGSSGFLVPGMIVQPFVENAVIHGIEPLERGGGVRIEAEPEGSGLRISIVDNGTGFDPMAIPCTAPRPSRRPRACTKAFRTCRADSSCSTAYGQCSSKARRARVRGSRSGFRVPARVPSEPALAAGSARVGFGREARSFAEHSRKVARDRSSRCGVRVPPR